MVTTNHLGEEKPNKNGTLMKIVEYTNTENIIVEFQDEHKFRMMNIETDPKVIDFYK